MVPGKRGWVAWVVRAVTATAAPAAAKRCAMAAPIPRLAPVTMATFPVRSDVEMPASSRNLPAVPVGDGVRRRPVGGRERVAGVIRQRDKRHLRVIGRNAEQLGCLLLLEQVQRRPCSAESTGTRGQHE